MSGKYDLSSIGAVSAAAELARARAEMEPSQGSYNAGWLHGYADALTNTAKQLEPQQRLIDTIIGYMGEQHDSAQLYAILHERLGLSDREISTLGFDLPQCRKYRPKTIKGKTIRVLVVEPGKRCHAREVPDELEALQNIVGGSIEAVFPFPDPVALICNGNGKSLGLPINRPLLDRQGQPCDFIRGRFFIAGVQGENFISLTDEQIRRFRSMFNSLLVLPEKGPRSSKQAKRGGKTHER